MGNTITALAPARKPANRTVLAKPKPAGTMLIQTLIESIDDLKNTLATRPNPPVKFVPPESERQHVEVKQVRPSDQVNGQAQPKRGGLLDFFD